MLKKISSTRILGFGGGYGNRNKFKYDVLPLSCFSSVIDLGEWTEEEIASLKEGLRKYGRAWGKIYREVGSQKTATQCKQFYDDFCNDELLNLNQALVEHSSIKVHSASLYPSVCVCRYQHGSVDMNYM